MSGGIVIRGQAYQRPASLDVNMDTLTWRARRGVEPENIATTIHELRDVTWLEKRWSPGAGILAALSVVWIAQDIAVYGLVTLAVAIALSIHRWLRPRYWLGLDLGTRWLVMRVDPTCADHARRLADRIQVRLLTGEV
nr:hypothetical protein [Deltaproteobacteria bacterium]